MIVFDDFKNEVEAIDTKLTVIRNPNHKNLANIMYEGRDICSIPSGEIKDDIDPNYMMEFPNGWRAVHRSRTQAIQIVNSTIESMKDPAFKEVFFSKE